MAQMNKVVGNYILKEKKGSGQYGNVYKAQHKTEAGFFAVKVMNVEKFKQQPKLTEFTNNEIQILSKMDHPNIIKFKEMMKTNTNFFLVYQYCEGGTLSELIKKKGKLPEEEALKYLDQLRNGFYACFKANILHRDIKPSNILFKEGVLKLADFGFCKQLLKQTDMTQTMVGSPIYMAPEVLKGQLYDARADIWSIGVILFEMLYGKCPYEQNSIPKLISLLQTHYLQFPNEPVVSENTKKLIKKLLTLDFHDRIDPYDFINLKLEKENEQNNVLNYKQVGKYIRRALIYLTQTLEILTFKVDELDYLRMSFLVFKIITGIQQDTIAKSIFWENVGIQITGGQWDDVLHREEAISKPYGQIVRQALKKSDTGLKSKVELETKYIDSRFYLQCLKKFNDDVLKLRLLNCFLYNKHFTLIKQKRASSWKDPASENIPLKQKQQTCLNYAKYY